MPTRGPGDPVRRELCEFRPACHSALTDSEHLAVGVRPWWHAAPVRPFGPTWLRMQSSRTMSSLLTVRQPSRWLCEFAAAPDRHHGICDPPWHAQPGTIKRRRTQASTPLPLIFRPPPLSTYCPGRPAVVAIHPASSGTPAKACAGAAGNTLANALRCPGQANTPTMSVAPALQTGRSFCLRGTAPLATGGGG